ncbi:MAG: InlB B-repeat-containing protein [Bacteroidales bacterium]|nr:InlB B-repeat-containing protein [Bacteroidales bacterium]
MKKIFLFVATTFMLLQNSFAQQTTHWSYDVHQFETNMTCNVVVSIDDEEQFNPNLEIGAFCGEICEENCRGAIIAKKGPGSRYFFYLTVHGNNGDQIRFKIYDHAQEAELDLECYYVLTFDSNGELGSLENPFVLEFYGAPVTTYSIGASAEPVGGGTVSGAGTYNEGVTVTMTATHSEHYHFVNWTEGGVVASTDATYTFIAESDRTLVANFGLSVYTITAAANPTSGGTVTGDGTYNAGETVTLTAMPNEGYHFVNWTEGGEFVSGEAEYVFDAAADRNLMANFASTIYTIEASAEPVESGMVFGVGSYLEGALVELVASPYVHYHFVNWTEDGVVVSEDAEYDFVAAADRNLTANFALDTYTVTATAEPVEGGEASVSNANPQHGESVTATATPNAGYRFVNWTENGLTVSEEAEFSFEAAADRDLVANFVEEGYGYTVTVAANPANGGVVAIDNENPQHGESVTVTATHNEGYRFVNWTEKGSEVSSDTIYVFAATADRTLVANFQKESAPVTHWTPCAPSLYEGKMSVTAILQINGEEQFTDKYEIGAFCGDECRAATRPELINGKYVYMLYVYGVNGNEITFRLYDHSIQQEIDLECQQTLIFDEESQAGLYTINFVGARIVVAADSEEGGAVSGGGFYKADTEVTVTASRNPKYDFINWTEDGEKVSTDAEFTFTATEGVRTLVAHFETQKTHWTPCDPSLYEGKMSVTAILQINDDEQFTDTYEIGAFCGDTCRAAIRPELIPGTGQYVYYLYVYGENRHEITFRLYDHEAGREVTEYGCLQTLKFEDMGSLGTLLAPYEINFVNMTIAATAAPKEGGTVTGAGDYAYNATATLKATASEHYHFLNWTENGEVVEGATEEYTFTVTANRTLVANFEPKEYTITATAEPEEGGAVEGADQHTALTEVTLTATPNAHYHFVNWTEGEEIVSSDTTYTFQALGNRDLVAHFELNKYTVIATASPAEGGAVNEVVTYSQEYTAFDYVTLTATHNEHYHFVNWTEGETIVSEDSEYTFTATGDRDLVAHFALNTYTVIATASPVDGGTVNGVVTYTQDYTALEEVTLTAAAAEHYHFVNWTAADGTEVSTSAEYTFTAEGDVSLMANFALNEYTIAATANPTVGGTVEGAGQYQALEEVTLKATAAEGYHFISWTENGTPISTNASLSFQATENRNFTANFELNIYEITVSASPAEGGEAVISNGNPQHGTQVTATATPNAHYTFVNWTENGNVVSTDATYTFTATGDRNLTANFVINIYVITATANPAEGGTVTGAGEYAPNADVTLTATANTGYHFVSWTENGTVVSTDATYSFNATSDRALVANFELNVYTITVAANPTLGGSAEVDNANPQHGTQVTATATPVGNYSFVNWTENGNVVSTDATYTFTATGDRNLTANFDMLVFTITATANPAEGGTITGAGSYAAGLNVTLYAAAKTGYTFASWTENGNVVSSDATYTFTATADRNLTANFVISTYTITATANPTEGGIATVDNASPQHGATVTATAIAGPGYHFVNWTENGTEVSTDAVYVFTATGDRYLTANFMFLSYEITVSSDPEEAGTVSGGGVYNYGENVTISFTANPGYVFMGWYVDDELLSEESTYTFMAESDMDIVAKGNPDGVADNITVEASVYPNPTRDNIKIECVGMERVVITSIQGKVVYDDRVMNDNVIINMSGFAQGSYIMNIYAKDGNVTKMVTVNK